MAGGTNRAESANFEFLRASDEQLFRLAALAERYFRTDPNTCIFKLRQFAELMAKDIAARTGLLLELDQPQVQILGALGRAGYAPKQALDLFHFLRRVGNDAAHGGSDDFAVALNALKVARQLAIWYARSYSGQPKLAPGPFAPPPAPPDPTAALREELERLRSEADDHRNAAELERARADALAEVNRSAEERAQREAADREVWQRLAEESETAAASIRATLQGMQQQAASESPQALVLLEEAAETAAEKIDLDEAATREIIDQQLRDAGWEADTSELRYAKGARPTKAHNLAIAEWPTASGPADYALFAGLKLIGVVEAKRRNKNVMSVLPQAERYSAGIAVEAVNLADGAPWGQHRAPFVFSTNGRPYLKQLETSSGIWRRDVRMATNPAAALVGWPTPQGLLERLEVDKEVAEANLATQGFDFGFPLRPYQKEAIQAVEGGLAANQTRMLLAMATGTGKTKLAIALLYRLIAAKRFRRVCFVVDRSALGEQTEREFTTTKVVSGKAFADIFGLKGLADVTPDEDTRIHICTIQGLVRRVLYSESAEDAPAVDQYDLMIVDECHRGYLLDREMSEGDMTFRSPEDYVSKYRRVLEHFDAVKIGLTATPALHTTEIFGKPIFTYSYREAVIDGFLVDHEPPIRIGTKLSDGGIHFVREERVDFLHPPSGVIETAMLPDDIDFDVEQFNKGVVTVAFNRAIAEELTNYIDPGEPQKTLVFAVSKAHADILVKELRDAFRKTYGAMPDATVQKLTGEVDHIGTLILAFRNDPMPKVAVTVDLLTTGIDVPRICNLVFMRRVNSRILYEQMLGRATRLCPEIDKEAFRIFDAVDLYVHLQDLTDMKPVAADPSFTLTRLFDELAGRGDIEHKDRIREQIIVRLRRRLKRLSIEARARFEKEAGETPEASLQRFATGDAVALSAWAAERPNLGAILDWTNEDGTPRYVPISQHDDEVTSVTRGYGGATRPEDFLDAFTRFVRENVNRIAALAVVVQRPQELTREELRQLRLELDAAGFTDSKIKRAWTDAKNEDIAASIIGYIRQAAIGDPLIPYSDRVRAAVATIQAERPWTEVQRNWIRRIGDQLALELVVDRAAFDDEPFAALGGWSRIDKVFNGELQAVVRDLNANIWKATGS
jgi:type I restriction enzyme, R subunit